MVEVNTVTELILTLGIDIDKAKFDPNKTFDENGIDSLDMMSIFLGVEEKLGVKLSDEELEGVSSVVALVAAINKK
jgi:acyl carrier protein